MGSKGRLCSSYALIPPGTFVEGQEPLPEQIWRGSHGVLGRGGEEVFHHAAYVWCQRGTAQKAHSIQCLLLGKPSSVARTACPETAGHSWASHPAEGSASQTGEVVYPLHHHPHLCRELTASSPRAPASRLRCRDGLAEAQFPLEFYNKPSPPLLQQPLKPTRGSGVLRVAGAPTVPSARCFWLAELGSALERAGLVSLLAHGSGEDAIRKEDGVSPSVCTSP